jgi:hypothetical protein
VTEEGTFPPNYVIGGDMKTTHRAILGAMALAFLVAGCGSEPVAVDRPDAQFAKGAERVMWRVPGDFADIQAAMNDPAVMDGHVIKGGPDEVAGAFVTKAVSIQGVGDALINTGPMHPAGLSMGFRMLAGSDGATIEHLTFEVDLAIMNGDAVHDDTVSHNTFLNTIQAVSQWGGSGWTISHNEIIDLRSRNGGGIGILVGARWGGVIEDNLISHNKINGTLHVWEKDGGGYAGTGVVLYADFRYGWPGAESINNNQIVQNKINLISDTPEVVDVTALELTDARDDLNADPVIFDNAIGLNDTRGTAVGLVLTPENLGESNVISGNLTIDVPNRGHGAHPSLFGPGGH